MPWASRDREAKRKADARYNAEYRRKREACLRAARWRCQIQLPGICIGSASEADHIDGVDADPHHDRLRAACCPCHRARTAQQGGGFRRSGGTREDPACQPRTAR